jgi:hypothetical protein
LLEIPEFFVNEREVVNEIFALGVECEGGLQLGNRGAILPRSVMN